MDAIDQKRETQSRQIYRIAYFAILPAIAASIIACLLAPEPYLRPLLLVALLLTLIGLHLSISATRNFKAHQALRQEADEKNRVQQLQMEELFAMTDLLQSADCHEHAGAVLEATSKRLLPDCGGALYVFNNSRDRLDLIRSWNLTERFAPIETLLPASCWAIKRGKPQINSNEGNQLCCFHHLCEAPTLEVPMMARGSLYGLLVFGNDQIDALARLAASKRIARALADSMSLALSNISLNEKLKTQSMRDPLTGLYNRRYMEDALERSIASSAREKTPTSVVMIDLDNFKRLNDEFGHAKGDAVLRDVAAHLVGSLRPSDTVCRYGGEELLLIFPNTGIDQAAIKAEELRMGVEKLSDSHGVPISASFGIAEHPNSTSDPRQLIAMADAALYEAKKDGKNCVRRAASPERSVEFQPKLVAH